jgi:MFS family permease
MATALPVIVHDLQGSASFAWVSTSYTLATTAILPLSGRLADVLGRRDVLLGSLLFFAAGSAICGTAHSMSVLIAGRGGESPLLRRFMIKHSSSDPGSRVWRDPIPHRNHRG